jgi:hypothetical protein
MRILALLSALFSALLFSASTLSATVVLPAEFSEVVNGSQIIVYGRVAEVRPEWTDGRRRIESVVTVEAASFLRGTPTRTVSFRVPGGQIGRLKSVTVGAPEFRAGEEVVLFLRGQGPSVPQVFGMHQGVYRVRVDARSGDRMVSFPLLGRTEEPQKVVRGAIERRPLPLAQFTQTVRTVLQNRGER